MNIWMDEWFEKLGLKDFFAKSKGLVVHVFYVARDLLWIVKF